MKAILKTFFIYTLFALNMFASDDIPEVLMEQSLGLFKHNNDTYITISFKSAPHWHTYWKNPGDAGLPTKISIEGIETSEASWPVPRKFIETGDILAYGYEKPFTRFYKLEESIQNQRIKISSEWLICKHICIPGKSEFNATLENDKLVIQKEWPFLLEQDELLNRFEKRPMPLAFPSDIDVTLKKSSNSNSLVLFYNLPAKNNQNIKMLGLLTPYPHALIDFKREMLFRDKQGHYYGRFTLDWDGEYSEPPVPLPSDGKFTKPLVLKFLYNDPVSKRHYVVEKSFKEFELTGEEKLTDLLKSMRAYDPLKSNNVTASQVKVATPEPQKDKTIWSFLIFAFLGGLILNIMPCVLPVISLKLFGLINHSTESKSRILKHNLFYTLGVLITFMALGLSVVALKATGQQVGWGFQLQSPIFISLTLIVLFVLTLNLFGLFEFATPGGKQLGNIQTSSGYLGDIFSGIIATVLSTPCSAPFLGTALTFAFTSETHTIFLIFFMIGLGLAFPFLITGFFPKTIKFLPKPGMWMEHVKKFLGLSLLLTMVWLFDVFISLTDSNTAFLKLITCLIFIFFAFYLRKNISKKAVWIFLFFGIASGFLFGLVQETMHTNTGEVSQSRGLIDEKNKNTDLNWIPWSEEKMNDLAKQKRHVFMDFTAKWCFTCKVNEKLVIQTEGFKKIGEKYDMVLLLADWTKYDPVIGAFLKKNGLVGVPAYFIQKPDGTLINLGETITLGKIEAALNN